MSDLNTPPDVEAAWRRGVLWLSFLVLLGVAGVSSAAAGGPEGDATVSGRVWGELSPKGQKALEGAQVYAYEVASLKLEQAMTDEHGRFLFESLPAGLYKIVAYKAGFVPSVELLMRQTKELRQSVELRLREEATGDVRAAESYWDARARIPADVLRQINRIRIEDSTLDSSLRIADSSLFSAQMVAESGYSDLGSAEGLLTGASVGVSGAVGPVAVGFDGRYEQLIPSGANASALPGGEVRSMAFYLESDRKDRVSLLSSAGEMANFAGGDFVPVDMRHYQLRWSGPTGEGTTNLLAQFIAESNYHRGLGVQPDDIPEASRTWAIEGSYRREVGEATKLKTGVAYRARETLDPMAPIPVGEEVSVYGVADSQIQPRILVEYGLYSSVNGSNLSLTPTGGMVVRLSDTWKARTSVSRRVESDGDGDSPYRDFNTAFYGDGTTCQQVGESCYEVSFMQGRDDEESFRVGAIHRQYAETLRLYFSDDFFNRLESLLVVPGDEVPEVQFRMVHKISPRVLAKLESNYAEGGGGIFYATDAAYENQVRYLVTSLDTRFQQTSTGVFIAFHHLEQTLNPTDGEGSSSQLEMERLQLMLTQDLSALADVTSKWALRLNMELSRGANPYTLTTDNELYKKLTGGITVSF